ncbi:MAG TPA: PilZ domain-containing protein [Terriglobales bacterium]|nr:PilZ domain-containing protein [Terriglobales bacterium]
MTPETGTEARRYSRVQLPVTAEVSCLPLGFFRHPASLRDVSAGGAYFYADISPQLGTVMKLDFSVPVVGSEVQISCEGPVVRVEKKALGEESGIAIEISNLNLGSW